MTADNKDHLEEPHTYEGVDIEAFLEEDDLTETATAADTQTKTQTESVSNAEADESFETAEDSLADASLRNEEELTKDNGKNTKKGIPDATKKRGYTKLELILVALLAIALVVIVRQSGTNPTAGQLPSGHPDISGMSQEAFGMGSGEDPHATPKVDENKIAELKKAAESDEKALEPRLELGKLYFDAKYYQDAGLYFEQALKLSPEDMELLLISGVTAFNINDFTTAEKHWKKATEVDPSQPEPWYNLGYVYLMQKPVNEAGLKQVWDKVLELAPESDMAADIKKYREQAPGPVSESKK